MSKKFLAWSAASIRENAQLIIATTHESAAMQWAHFAEFPGGEYANVRVFVATSVYGSKSELFNVRREMRPVYFATKVST